MIDVVAAITFLTIAEVIALPLPQYIVKNLFWEQTLIQIVGPSGSGKTGLALNIVLHIATGTPWAGQRVRQMQVVYVAAEGVRSLGKRLKAWQQEFGVTVPPEMFLCIPRAINLANPEEVEEFIRVVLDRIQTTGTTPGVIVFDTRARCTIGAEENSNTAMSLVVAACDRIITEVGCAVMLIHHTGKNESYGGRGATAVYGALDTEVAVKSAANNMIGVSISKQKDEAPLADMKFGKRRVVIGVDGEGDEISSFVIDSEEPIYEDSTSPNERCSENQRVVLEIVAAAGTTGATWDDVRRTAMDKGVGKNRSSALAEIRKALIAKRLIVERDGRLYVA